MAQYHQMRTLIATFLSDNVCADSTKKVLTKSTCRDIIHRLLARVLEW